VAGLSTGIRPVYDDAVQPLDALERERAAGRLSDSPRHPLSATARAGPRPVFIGEGHVDFDSDDGFAACNLDQRGAARSSARSIGSACPRQIGQRHPDSPSRLATIGKPVHQQSGPGLQLKYSSHFLHFDIITFLALCGCRHARAFWMVSIPSKVAVWPSVTVITPTAAIRTTPTRPLDRTASDQPLPFPATNVSITKACFRKPSKAGLFQTRNWITCPSHVAPDHPTRFLTVR
jgi:hypothetical protein